MFSIIVSLIRNIARYAALVPVAALVALSAIDFDTVRQYLLEADADDVQSACLQLMLLSVSIGLVIEALLPTLRQTTPRHSARLSQRSAMTNASVDQPQRSLALQPNEYYVRELWRP